jgi:hypothetical protein
MTRYRYRGDREHIYLGPPVRVMSPGDIVDLTTTPDPSMFEPVPDPGPADHRPSDPDPLDPGSDDLGSSDDDGPAAAGGEVAEATAHDDESSGPAGVPDGDAAPGSGGEPG